MLFCWRKLNFLWRRIIDNKNTSQNHYIKTTEIADEKKIDLTKIQGTGKDGRILKGDLIMLMGKLPQPSDRKIKYGSEEIIKMTRLRLTIAKRLKEAQENAAILTSRVCLFCFVS